MKATKYTLKVEIQVLSKDTVENLLLELITALQNENPTGLKTKEDGDFLSWKTIAEKVEF